MSPNPNACPAHSRIEARVDEIYDKTTGILVAMEGLKTTVRGILAVAVIVGAVIQGVSIAWFSNRIERMNAPPVQPTPGPSPVSMQQAANK